MIPHNKIKSSSNVFDRFVHNLENHQRPPQYKSQKSQIEKPIFKLPKRPGLFGKGVSLKIKKDAFQAQHKTFNARISNDLQNLMQQKQNISDFENMEMNVPTVSPISTQNIEDDIDMAVFEPDIQINENQFTYKDSTTMASFANIATSTPFGTLKSSTVISNQQTETGLEPKYINLYKKLAADLPDLNQRFFGSKYQENKILSEINLLTESSKIEPQTSLANITDNNGLNLSLTEDSTFFNSSLKRKFSFFDDLDSSVGLHFTLNSRDFGIGSSTLSSKFTTQSSNENSFF